MDMGPRIGAHHDVITPFPQHGPKRRARKLSPSYQQAQETLRASHNEQPPLKAGLRDGYESELRA
jgi:hypothetical protein